MKIAKQKTSAVTASDLRALLRARFSGNEWALLFEVKDATGGRARRSADAVAMNLWPSRGLEVHGFEFKCSRADWLGELRQPAKSAEVQQFCDRWWLVAAEEKIVLPGELPPTWGLLAASGGRLRVRTEAPKLEAQPLDRFFVASLLRNAVESLTDKSEVETVVRQRVQEMTKEKQRREELFSERHDDSLRASVRAFEAASGVKIDEYNGEKLGAAVRVVLDCKVDGAQRMANQAADALKYQRERMERAEAELREAAVRFL